MTQTPPTQTSYDNKFYANQLAGSVASARAVVPMLRELVKFHSVVDVGCGTGTWLSVFAETGTTDYLGIDGPWAEQAGLRIPRDRFIAADLRTPPSEGVAADRRFDLAVSVEVAEHLPPTSASAFIAWLTSLAPVVVFSAAIPGQGGTDHVNEQWPDYWAGEFESRGFACIDCLRMRLWAHPDVQWWYAQNILIFADRTRLHEQPVLSTLAPAKGTKPARLVHPSCFETLARQPLGLGRIVRDGPRAVERAIKAGLRSVRGKR